MRAASKQRIPGITRELGGIKEVARVKRGFVPSALSTAGERGTEP